jgi:hypothetical protein
VRIFRIRDIRKGPEHFGLFSTFTPSDLACHVNSVGNHLN